MEDFHAASGLPVVLKELGDLLHTAAPTVNGRTLGENVDGAVAWDREVIRTADGPLLQDARITVLHVAPSGAVIKPAAASPHLLRHTGTGLVFEGMDDFRARIDDPDLPVEAGTVLVLRNVGPRGFPGMPEVGNLSLPRKLQEAA
ncbi:dihydroxy-acid dehydratase [Actinomadura citrea]|nr:dihydroxy-acid dehydratase [Actinomadura citrea]